MKKICVCCVYIFMHPNTVVDISQHVHHPHGCEEFSHREITGFGDLDRWTPGQATPWNYHGHGWLIGYITSLIDPNDDLMTHCFLWNNSLGQLIHATYDERFLIHYFPWTNRLFFLWTNIPCMVFLTTTIAAKTSITMTNRNIFHFRYIYFFHEKMSQ